MVTLQSIIIEISSIFLNIPIFFLMKHYENIIMDGPSTYYKFRQKIGIYILESYSHLIFFQDK